MDENQAPPQAEGAPKKKSKAKSMVFTIVIVLLLGVIGTIEYKRQIIQKQFQKFVLQSDQVELGDPEENQEAADKIVRDLRKIIDISEETEPTVATIVDIEALRERNSFYSKAENGDHLVVTPERAILYSSKKKKIIDVVPVQLQPVGASGGAPTDAEDAPAS